MGSQLNVRVVHGKEVDLLVNFALKLASLFFFNLPLLKHGTDVVVFMSQHEILGSSVLDGLSDFWKHFFNVVMHVSLR